MWIYFYTQDGVITTWYIPALTSNPDQGFIIWASSNLSGSTPLYAVDWNINTSWASANVGANQPVTITLTVPDEISVTTLYLTSRNSAQYTHPPQAYSLEWRAVWGIRETIKSQTSITFTTYNETLTLPINDTGKYSFFRLTLRTGSTGYVALQSFNIDAVVRGVRPRPQGWTQFDFTQMSQLAFEDLFSTDWVVTFIEWTGVEFSDASTAYIDTGINATGYNGIEIYYSGYKSYSSMGYFSWVNNTVVLNGGNYYWDLAIHGWTHDNSNTAWAINGGFISNVSGRATAHYEYRFVYTFSTWAWEVQENGTTYATWTYSNPSFVTNRLNQNIVLQACTNGSGKAIIETAGFELF